MANSNASSTSQRMIRPMAIDPQRGRIGSDSRLRTLDDHRREDGNENGQDLEFAVEWDAVQYGKEDKRPDRDQRRQQELQQHQLPDQDAALVDDRFVHCWLFAGRPR